MKKPHITKTPGKTRQIAWYHLSSENQAKPASVPGAADRSIHVYGRFDGATLVIRGSNQMENPDHFVDLHDAWGNVLSFSERDNAMQIVAENVLHIVPVVVGGRERTDLRVAILARSTM